MSVRRVGNLEPAFAEFWHPVAMPGDVDAGPVHVQVAGLHYVVARINGTLCAFQDACPHRSFPLSEGAIVGGHLRCRYHGYCFDERGTCTAIPAIPGTATIAPKAGLSPAAGVTEHLGFVWLAPKQPRSGLPPLPEIDDDRFGRVVVGPQTWRAGAAQMTDNFLDVSHFPYVHAGTFGLESDALIPPYSVTREGLSFTYQYEHRFRNGAEVAVLQGTTQPEQTRRITSRFHPPFAVEFRVDYLETGHCTVLLTMSVPVDGDTSRVFGLLLGTDITAETKAASLDFEEKIIWEDQLALERYREREMVLDLDAEYHTVADRMTVEFRRVLHDILTEGATS